MRRTGIYVAFDRFGAHYDYARHFDSERNGDDALVQAGKIAALKADAASRGGKVDLLTLEEFDALILTNWRIEAGQRVKNEQAA